VLLPGGTGWIGYFEDEAKVPALKFYRREHQSALASFPSGRKQAAKENGTKRRQ
jgi:hypothetical protein